jgi:hypothetical protein
MRVMLAIAAACALVGCAISQEVNPVPMEATSWSEVCIIKDPDVKEGFLNEYVSTLERLGYQVRILPSDSELTACPITSTYMARWSWDWFWTAGVYMSYAQIKVYRDGHEIGDATYDARGGDANPDLIIDAEPKIQELVTALFPRRV